MEMKGSKKRKARQLDDIDYIPILKPIPDAETAQKVAAAMRQTLENSRVLSYLLQRIKVSVSWMTRWKAMTDVQITDDAVVHRQLMRMHGFSLMSMVLNDLAEDKLLVSTALEAMYQWKLQEKNKVEDSGIQESVEKLVHSPDARVSAAAGKLLEYWSTLVISYRIARKPKITSLDEEDEATTTTIAEADSQPRSAPTDRRRPQAWENDFKVNINIAPVHRAPPTPVFARPRPPPPPPPLAIRTPSNSAVAEKSRLEAIIALAQQSATSGSPASGHRGNTHSPAGDSSPRGSRTPMESPAPLRPVEEIWAEEERRKEQEKEKERRKRQRRLSEHAEKDDKRAKKLIGDVVVHVMSKHKHKMEKHHFKSYAQQCTELLVDKEKKGKDYAKFCRMSSLPDDKRKKIKTFVEEYAAKVLKKLEAKGKLREADVAGKAGESSANGLSSHEPSATPGDSYTLATPDHIVDSTPASLGRGSSRTPADKNADDTYGDSDLEMDIDIDAELEEHTFTAHQDRPNGV